MSTPSHPAAHAAFWHERWTGNQIGFHEGAPNRYLTEHWDLDVSSVLVPLCGKSTDLAWLAERGHAVTGVELSPIACEAFFQERGITPTRTPSGAFVRWEGQGVTLLQGDFFELEGHFDAFWDRAAMIALPADVRPRYAAHLRRLAPKGLLVTLAYDQAKMEGPPFSVPVDEVRAAHPDAVLLASDPADTDRLQAIGATNACFRVG